MPRTVVCLPTATSVRAALTWVAASSMWWQNTVRTMASAFFYEESYTNGGYDMLFRDYSLSEITGGEFEAK